MATKKKSPKRGTDKTRRERQAEALRANLRKRKAQAKRRKAPAPKDGNTES